MMEKADNLKLIYDIEVEISVILGKLSKNIEYLLNLKEGELLELNKNIEDYLEVYIQDIPFGKGELVIVNDKFGVRLIDLVK